VSRSIAFVVLAACGGGSSAPASAPKPAGAPAATSAQPSAEQIAAAERAHHDELAAAHRKLEAEQQEALAATCPDADKKRTVPGAKVEAVAESKHERCLPSCYPTEPADRRVGTRLGGPVEIVHLVCEDPAHADAYVIADEIDARLVARAARGRFPPAHKQGSWQAGVETALAAAPKLSRGDVVFVSGSWRPLEHPLTKERMRCVQVSHYVRSLKRALDACGGDGAIACEAGGNAAARAINVVHFRLVEARRLQAAGATGDCQQAALEAVAVARGLPRWRQYAKLNVGKWVEHAGYRTRFDGTLDEDALIARAAELGAQAEAVYTSCGGAAGAPTTAAQEQSFHTCW
jgi:hypothetical protein